MKDNDAALDERLRELRFAMQGVAAPAALEAPLFAKFRRNARPARPSLWWIPPLALAATIALVSWIIRGPLPSMDAAVQAQALADNPSDDAPFLALRPLERAGSGRGHRAAVPASQAVPGGRAGARGDALFRGRRSPRHPPDQLTGP